MERFPLGTVAQRPAPRDDEPWAELARRASAGLIATRTFAPVSHVADRGDGGRRPSSGTCADHLRPGRPGER